MGGWGGTPIDTQTLVHACVHTHAGRRRKACGHRAMPCILEACKGSGAVAAFFLFSNCCSRDILFSSYSCSPFLLDVVCYLLALFESCFVILFLVFPISAPPFLCGGRLLIVFGLAPPSLSPFPCLPFLPSLLDAFLIPPPAMHRRTHLACRPQASQPLPLLGRGIGCVGPASEEGDVVGS